MENRYKLRSNQNVNILPIGDFHIGVNNFNRDFFESMLERISALDKKRIYLMGDLLDTATKRVGNSAFETNMSLEKAREYLIDSLEPFKKDIICYCRGNHENRQVKDYGYDIVADISRELDTMPVHSNIDEFQINDFTFSVFTRHGKGSSKNSPLAMNKLLRETQDIVADLYLEGHNHRLTFFNQIKNTAEGYKRVYYGHTGAFLDYTGSYAEAQYLPMEPASWQCIAVNKNRIVKSNQYFDDGLF